MPVGDALPEILLLVAAVTALLVASFVAHARQWICALVALAGVAAALAASVAQLGDGPRATFSGTWALDDAAVWAKLIVLGASALATLLVPEWLRRDRRHGEHYAVVLFAALGAMLMAGALDTIELVLGVLLSAVTGYTLAAYHRASALSVEAGMKFFLIGALTNALLLVGVVLLFGLLGDTRYDAMAAALAGAEASAGLSVGLALVVVGLTFKLGAVPAHAWMPDVAQGAPAPSAAFLTIVPKVGAAVALARLLELFPDGATGWRTLVAALAVATMTLGNLAAFWQQDVRRLLGWSSVSQSGYALIAITVIGLSADALPALLFFLAAYAAANLAAFAVVTELRGRTALDDYRGLWQARPTAAAVLIVSFLSLVGIPPLAGFVGKLMLFLAAIDAGYAWLAAVGVANTVASLFYYARVIAPVYFDAGPAKVATLGRAALAAMLLAAALVVGLGLGAEALLMRLAAADLAV